MVVKNVEIDYAIKFYFDFLTQNAMQQQFVSLFRNYLKHATFLKQILNITLEYCV